jgi:hypothetical protein
LLNKISGLASHSDGNCGQATNFNMPNAIPGRPGRTPFFPNSPFKVDFQENNVIVWLLGFRTCTASKLSSRCPELGLFSFLRCFGISARVFLPDTTPPVFTTCPASVTLNVPATSYGKWVELKAAATDNLPGVHVSNDFTANMTSASAFYPIGVTTVTFTAEDSAANRKLCVVTVTIKGACSYFRVCLLSDQSWLQTRRLQCSPLALLP